MRLALAATLSRITTSMLSLSLLLTTVTAYDSYAAAGAVLTAHALALAVCSPVIGRLVDRHGPRHVLLCCVVAHGLAYGGLLLSLGQQAGIGPLVATAAVIGASNPPSSSITRAQWPALVPPHRLPTAYAFDSTLNSTMFIVGPLLVSGLVLVATPFVAVLVGGTLRLAGDVLLFAVPSLSVVTRSPVPARHRRTTARRILGPLADAPTCLLLVAIALDTFTLGGLNLGAVASAGAAGWSGVLIGAVAAGEVLGSLSYGSRQWAGGHLFFLHLLAAAALTVAGVFLHAVVLAVLCLAIGLASGGRDTANQLAVNHLARPEHRTEIFSWLSTVMWAGFGIGTAGAGLLQTHAGTRWIFFTAAAASAVAAVIVRFGVHFGDRSRNSSSTDQPVPTSSTSQAAEGRRNDTC
jgi:MFS family permease